MNFYCECDSKNEKCSCKWEFKKSTDITDWERVYSEIDSDEFDILHINCPNLKDRKIVRTFGTAIVVAPLD